MCKRGNTQHGLYGINNPHRQKDDGVKAIVIYRRVRAPVSLCFAYMAEKVNRISILKGYQNELTITKGKTPRRAAAN